jgi:hypothetical protein
MRTGQAACHAEERGIERAVRQARPPALTLEQL